MAEPTESESRKLLGRLREALADDSAGQARLDRVTEVIVAPGNAGTAAEPKVRNVNVGAEDIRFSVGLIAV